MSSRPGPCGSIFCIYHYCHNNVTTMSLLYHYSMVPIGTGNQGKPGKMGRHFPVREKSGNFVKTGKVREFYSKYWENWEKLYWKIEKNTVESGKFVSQ